MGKQLGRYTASGADDPDFNFDTDEWMQGNGVLMLTADTSGLALQSDGKIVVAGLPVEPFATKYGFALARYHADGTADTDFGTNGRAITDFGENDIPHTVALQHDSKIVVAGQTGLSPNTDFALARHHEDGTPDTGFGTNGQITTDFGGTDVAFAIALQPDGKIVVAGVTFTTDSGLDIALARYNENGTLDTTFGDVGKVVTDFGANDEMARALALQPDGKLLVAVKNASGDFTIARYTAAGVLDTGFGTNGTVTTDINGANDRSWALALQPDGKILVAGEAGGADTTAYAVARYQGDPVGLTPNPVGFTDVTNQDLAAPVTTSLVTVSGLADGLFVPVAIQGGEYALNGAAAYSTGTGWVRNGTKINVRHTTAATPGTATNTVLSIGGLRTANNAAVLPGATIATFTSTTHHTPLAQNDSAATPSNTAVTISVLANDSDPEGAPLSIAAFDTASSQGGAVTDNGDGTLTYTPPTGFTGPDTFTYTVSDGRGATADATVTVTVNDPPVAHDLTIAADQGNPVSGILTASDANGDTLTFAIVANGAKGTAEITNAATGAFTYTPNPGATGTDTFTFAANDGTADSSPATVSVTLPAPAGGGGGALSPLALLLGLAAAVWCRTARAPNDHGDRA